MSATPAAIRSTALELLRAHDAADGRGADSYNANPRVHPMADGIFLEAAGVLHRAGVLGESEGRRIARRALTRLRARAINGAWGLGFAWERRPADAVYAITTAMVLRGLVEAAGLLIPEEAEPLRAAALQSLRAEREGGIEWDGLRLTPYGSHDRSIAWNVVVQSAYAEHLADPTSRPGSVYDLVTTAREGLLWHYGPENPRIDLLHNCYIAEPLLRAGLLDPGDAVATISPFLYTGLPIDRLEPITDEEGLLQTMRRGELLPLEQPLRRLAGAPRPWSLAAALNLLAMASAQDHRYLPLLRELASQVIEDQDPGARQPRHAAHRCLALAEALLVLRKTREPRNG